MRLLIIPLLALSACAEYDQNHDQFEHQQVIDSCPIAPLVIATDFADAHMEHTIDRDGPSSVHSGLVAPGDTRHIDINYGCPHKYLAFQIMNAETNAFTMSRITVYVKERSIDPWVYDTEFTEADTQYDGIYWTFYRRTHAKFVRYVYNNETLAPVDFIISDIESEAIYDGPQYE